jgi:hypothetical protein
VLSEQQQPCSQDGTLTVRNGPTVTAPCRIFPRCSSTYPSFIESLAFLASSWPIICSTDPDQAHKEVKNRTLTDRTSTVPGEVADRAASDVRIWIQVGRHKPEVGQTPV